MGIFLVFEASRPCGTKYRLGFGCLVHPKLASMVVALLGLR